MYYSSENAKDEVRFCNNLPFGRNNTFEYFSIKLPLAVPVDQIEAASRELRSYLVSKNSIALSVLDHLDSNYIFGKSVFEN